MPRHTPILRIRSTCTALLFSDLCALLTALSLGVVIRFLSGGIFSLSLYVDLVPGLLLFLVVYATLGLYPGILRPASEELKRLTLGSSLGFLFLSFILFLTQQGPIYSRFIIAFCWLAALLVVPLFRYITRRCCANKAWWGYPAVLFAPADTIADVEQDFREHREMGLFIAESIPLDREGSLPASMAELSLSADKSLIPERVLQSIAERHPGALAFLLADSLHRELREPLIMLLGRHFRQVLVHLDRHWLKQVTLHVVDAPGGQVLTLRQNLLDPARMRMKRFLDILFCLLGSAFLLLAIPLIALCVRLDSKGPVFFTQKRIGRGGKPIYVVKFRTMAPDAQERLDRLLAANSALREEWEKGQKLAHDPRLTRVGLFLRRTSLDELPQVFNVIKGEMSLVGPRPIVESEVARYGDGYELYTRVRPGITGLWQVSGRNDLRYDKRVALDKHYVYNWSVWLDIYIMIRTIPALVTGRGAY